jgi:heme exporter protein C
MEHIFALRSALDNEEKRARLSAAYSIIAGLTVPFFIFVYPILLINKTSVRIHRSSKE